MISRYFKENTSAADIAALQNELLRVVGQTSFYNAFTLPNGSTIQGATESDVIKHLTSARDYVSGRQYRFPGIGSGWYFSEAIEAAGFKIVQAKNYRGQTCSVVTL